MIQLEIGDKQYEVPSSWKEVTLEYYCGVWVILDKYRYIIEPKEGEEVEVKVISVDRKNRVIALSIKAKDVQDEKDAVRQHREQDTATEAVTTIGGLIKAKLDDK